MIYIIGGIWQGAGWSSIMYTARAFNASQELKEAAMLDGANLIQQIRTVEWPTIKDGRDSVHPAGRQHYEHRL